MKIVVDASAGSLTFDAMVAACAIGRNGTIAAADKREGDGKSPLGRWPVRAALLRSDSGLAVPRHLPWRWLRRQDGWSDAPADPGYNRPVRHPHPWSAEHLWRADHLYDAILILGHNDDPPIAGLGSAIFLHLGADRPTEGCVAVNRTTMQRLLEEVRPGTVVEIR